ncbi:hypothetical protein GLOTRDRAFT_115584 [Gloeophyllum trabeum ATCC 11539]|uniref:Helicase C-terminal domain-containing protein n=1 Tax=Gloeophyllum trabeum (strain ATCC 11539 / FP-39264 / Madison 617) TaxID=670483 RepID=S7Q9Q7_GLOTA|nr:uncharacterized protein GLOTRDRAFT_115584 [Gloeophyllum trabeum ATCC 11539]EPQ56257.1 hypothetical protein GLOTRDRAFT_115584 [Gloeophyllum trabeum ATCC 11539]
MAKAKATSQAGKGQKSIADYFGGGNKKGKKTKVSDDHMDVDTSSVADATADEEDDHGEEEKSVGADEEYVDDGGALEDDDAFEEEAVDEASADEAMSVDEEVDEDMHSARKATSTAKSKSALKGLGASRGQDTTVASDLPPISDIRAMFSDLVSHIPDIQKVAKRIQGRTLRVATMCSGTESPLLALEMICEAIQEQYRVTLKIEHVFSCEIEPFKQAYIERNFRPPILFRDVCELSEDYATTAYGATVEVPGDVDMLVAGTSCVDYSNLNTKKQDIDANGESGRTFRGMMSWVRKHRPPIVILENVCSAPWDKVVKYFEEHKYSATSLRLDTKSYYIPHTRTRGYLLAVDQKKSSLPREWLDWLKRLKRAASSTLDEFLLPSDDPRIQQSREKLVREGSNALDRRSGRTDWGRCESRHQRTRLEEQLGSKRPHTNWDENGLCKMPDFTWGPDWGIVQVERVWDLMDITVLKKAKDYVDPNYKTQVWNLSQNVDRNVGEGKEGICPCLTPSMIPYISNRGGPMVGLEALCMQGLPIDKLLLTKETEDQLADLAGNAMSTTVVGACMLAALVVSVKLLKPGDDTETYESKGKTGAEGRSTGTMNVDEPEEAELPIEEHVVGEERLTERPLDLSAMNQGSLSEILAAAQRSVRLCICEGRTAMTERRLNRCVDCSYTSCEKCGGRPEHNYQLIAFDTPRVAPGVFARELKATLPMSLSVANVTQETLVAIKEAAGVSVPERHWPSWCSAVLRAVANELHFVEPKRQEIWTAVYQSPSATLELSLHPLRPEWRLYAKPEAKEPASSKLRKILETPVARFVCKDSLFDGVWEIGVPSTTSVKITIEGSGELVPSWEARLGLQSPEFRDRQVYSRIKVTVPENDVDKFDRDISGEYELLDRCGTACCGLHKQVSELSGLPPLFLLFDPARVGPPDEDCFAFSISTKRYEFGEARPIICRLSPEWRQHKVIKEGTPVKCDIPTKWVEAEDIAFKFETGHQATFASVEGDVAITADCDACRSADALLVCRVALDGNAGPEWPRDHWVEVDKINERLTFRSLAWIIERIRSTQDKLKEWQDVDFVEYSTDCQRCAPTAPNVRWMRVNKKILPIEDTVQAGEYERRLKRRPAPFVTQLKLGSDGVGTIRIGVNIASLLHRAMSRLPKAGRAEKHALSWHLDTDFAPAAKLNFPKFKLLSNRNDPTHAQPPNFKLDLRPEQLRSLGWMLRQESRDAPPFIEEEIAEAILEPLGWRAEGRARRPVRVSGGVLADEVGYGKTAITLGLIDWTLKDIHRQYQKANDMPGKIRSRATLVVVPPHLTRQWASEAKKFVGTKLKVVSVETAAKINALTVEAVCEADILVVASNLFHSSVYLDNLEAFAAGGTLPSSDGRYFKTRLQSVLMSLRKQVDLLKEGDSKKVMQRIHEGRKIDEEADALIPTKRLKGKAYREAAEKTTQAGTAAPSPGSPALATPKGLVPEVVITSRRSSCSSVTKSSNVDESSGAEQCTTARPRKTSKKTIVISDDDDDAAITTKAKTTKKATGTKRRRQVDSDQEDYVMETSSSKSQASSSDADMDVDEISDSKPKGKGKPSAKKRRTVAAPAKKRREDTDPWKLLTSAVRNDWTQMRAPPLEMFHFARVVVDEYTYLEGKDHALITNLTTDRRWVLSGTPPLADFASLKTIAAFLNLHLGVDDEDEFQDKEKKRRKKDQTTAEQFHSFREVHSLEWHAHRHDLGQGFLNQFVRQNIAEIDEIPWTEKVVKVELPAAERAIYLELEHHLRALDMTIKRGRKTESDREKRLTQALGESQSAEEALLKRCSHFELEDNDEENAMTACETIVQRRHKELEACKADLLKHLQEAVAMERKIGRTSEESMFQEFVRVSRSEGVGDAEASQVVLDLLDEAGVAAPLKTVTNKPHDPRAGGSSKGKSKADEALDDLKWKHREQTHVIRRLAKELVGRVRSLRYFTVVRDLQKQREVPPEISCPACGKEGLSPDEIAVLSSCGHTGCYECVKEHAGLEECVAAQNGGCKSAARVINVVRGNTLGVDDVEREGRGKHYGMKLEKVIDLIKEHIPKDERVLIFVQFQDLTKKVAEALEAHHVPFLEIKGSASSKSKALEKFQNDSEERVLLLNVTDESASGANLTGANHAIFLSPLLGPSQDWYTSRETQAIGRIRRYGQQNHVNVWRFLSTNTIDEEIYEQRTGKKV